MMIKNNEARIHKLGNSVTLMPGVNEIDGAAWKEAKKILVVQELVKSGVLEVVGKGSSHEEEGEESEEEANESIDNMTVADASALIGETFDKALLNKWKKADKRKGVHDAIEAQLEVVKHPKEEESA